MTQKISSVIDLSNRFGEEGDCLRFVCGSRTQAGWTRPQVWIALALVAGIASQDSAYEMLPGVRDQGRGDAWLAYPAAQAVLGGLCDDQRQARRVGLYIGPWTAHAVELGLLSA